ncbi:MAG: DNA-3-methyladenine glycosylase family protein [Bosea sp. (in: a-proteobacteria)]
MTRITCDADVRAGMDGLQALSKKRHGPQWQAIIAASGAPPLRLQQGGFEGLARIIVSQQLSVASARAIWAKVEAIIVPLTPERFLAATDDELRQAGLSRPKQRTLLAISAAVVDKTLVLEGLADATAEDIHAQMTAVKGIGPWTADIYLMFCLGHADAFAPGDLALQEAARIGFGLKKRPNPKEMAKIAENWKPHRGVAARLLWAYYAVVKTREGINAG